MRASLLASLASILNAAGAFGVSALLARILGPADNGFYLGTVTVATLLGLLLSGGTGTALRLQFRGREGCARDVGAFVAYSILASMFGGLLTWAFARVVFDDALYAVLVGVSLSAFFVARQSVDMVVALSRPMQALLASGFGSYAQLAVVLGLLGGQALTLNSALLSFIFGGLAQCTLAVFLAGRRGNMTISADGLKRRLRSLIAEGLPVQGYALGSVALQRSGRILLGAIAGSSSLGVYGVASSLAELCRLLPNAIGQFVFNSVAVRDFPAARMSYRCGAVGAVVSGLLIICALPFAVPILYGDAYGDSIALGVALVVAEIAMSLTFLESRWLNGSGCVKLVSMCTLSWLAIALPLYCVLISRFGAWGAATSCIICSWGFSISLRLLRQRRAAGGFC